MAKAYFNRNTGKFEIRFRDGRHFIWNEQYWVPTGNSKPWKSNSFKNWYERKGRQIENQWKRESIQIGQTRTISYEDREVINKLENDTKKKGKLNKIAILSLTVILLVGGYMILNWSAIPLTNINNNSLSMQVNVIQPNQDGTLNWTGPGYYNTTNKMANGGNPAGIYYISSQDFILKYNKEIKSISTTTIIPEQTTTIATTTTIPVTTTILSPYGGFAINSTWATSFFSKVSSYKIGSQPLSYCPKLSSFAQIRFNTMASNINYSHYGSSQDLANYIGSGYSTLEEVLYPSGYTPSGYATYLISADPIHWQGLINNSYAYYGYYSGNANFYAEYGCGAPEIPGPNINIPQFLKQQGCTLVIKFTTWFVVELANACPT